MTDDRKEELIERHRDINANHDWWDAVYEDFDIICKCMGIDVDKGEPCFSGFCSQGDGASFTGTFNGEVAENAPEEIRKHAPLDKKLHRIADELCMLGRLYYRAYAHISRLYGTNYYHQYTMFITGLEPMYGDADDWADAVHALVEDGLQDLFRDLAGWLYSSLDVEYDYLTSDEAVWDTIVANDLHKEEEYA